MVHHISSKTIESKSFPGVRFVLKKMTKRRAETLEDQLSHFRERLRPLYEEFTPLDTERRDAISAAIALVQPERDQAISNGSTEEEAALKVPVGKVEFPEDKLKRWVELWAQINKINDNEMEPVSARFCLLRIEDLDITYPGPDGQDATSPATLDLIMEHGPDELYQEIMLAVKRECGLLPEEAENLGSASTSAAAVDTKPVSADLVEKQEMTLVSAA
jgi:hypothetical protein